MLNRKSIESPRIGLASPSLPLWKMAQPNTFGYPQKKHTPRDSSSNKLLLSNRILTVLAENKETPLLGDEHTILNGKTCLEIIKKLQMEVEQVTPANGRVAILFPPSLAQSLTILSVFAANRVPVILNHWIDPKTLNHLITDNNLHSLVTFPQPLGSPIPLIPQIEFSDEMEVVRTIRSGFFDKPVPEPDTALILYTSGSTGKSKAVKIRETALIYMIDLLIDKLHLNSESIATITLPIFHTMALVTQFLPTFFAGGKSVIINSELSTGKLYRLIQKSNGTFVAVISDMLKYCKEEKTKRNLDPAYTIKLVQLAGGHISSKHIELAQELFPNAVIYKGYGLTEAIRVSMISSNDPLFFKDSAGYPLDRQTVEIRNSDGDKLPPNESGEIFVSGPNLMLGYEGASPSRIGADGFLATGDFGKQSVDGLLVIEGRRDQVFKSNGRKIACKELEEIAIKLPVILKAKCISVNCHQKGLKPVLFVEINPEQIDLLSRPWKNDLVKILRHNLDPYKVPKDVIVTSLPVLANGKIDQTSTADLWKDKSSFKYLGKASFGCHFHYKDRRIR